MATYVLVHGAAVGGWYWKRVVPLLRSAGHEVYTPTLTGLGERSHLFSPDITLETQISDIAGVIQWEDLHDVILVGHARGGIVATGAADRHPERVAHLVYMDGLIPVNGKSEFELAPEPMRAFISSLVSDTARGQVFNLPDVRNFGWIDEADADWFNSKVTPDLFSPWTEPLMLHNETALTAIPRTYINCIGDAPDSESTPTWAATVNYRELHASHLVMISAPQELANTLLELAPA